MNLNAITEILPFLAAAGNNIGLVGQPGVGKTEIVEQWVKGLRACDIFTDLAEPGDENRPVRFIKIATTTKESVDVSGMMRIENGVTTWCPPAWVPVGNEPAVVFMDEMPQSELSTQLAFQKLIDRDLDGCNVSKRALFIVAGNRTEDNCGANDIPMHIRNRFAWFEVECNVAAWRSWAENNGVLKVIIDFIGFCPERLNEFSAESQENAYATPRSIVKLSKTLEKAPKVLWTALATAHCGMRWAAEFAQFVKLYDEVPSVEAVLAAADTHKLPTDFGVLNALTSAIVRHVNEDKSKADAAITIVDRMYNAGSDELAAKLLRDITQTCPEVFATPKAGKLFAKMQSLIIA